MSHTQKAIIVTAPSNTYETIKYADIPIPEIAANEILVKNKYAGINFVESSFRKGKNPTIEFPYTLGSEGSGVVSAVGAHVKNFAVGDKVAYLGRGAFSQYINLKAAHPLIYKLDKNVSEEHFKIFGSVLIQALTAITFVDEAHLVKAGQNILVWAAAGGVGQAFIQLIAARGANAIAIASTPEKLAIAKKLGAKYLINALTDDVEAKVLEFTNGEGVDASFDPVGKDTFDVSLKSLARKGTFVLYGSITGNPAPEEYGKAFSQGKNIKIVTPGLLNYVTTPKEWNYYFEELKTLVESGKLVLEITRTYPLSEYADAARALEHRETTGKLTLEIPQ